MKSLLPLLTLGALLAVPAMLQANITRTVEKTFTVHAGGTLKVQTAGGDIKVLSGPGNEQAETLTIAATISGFAMGNLNVAASPTTRVAPVTNAVKP